MVVREVTPSLGFALFGLTRGLTAVLARETAEIMLTLELSESRVFCLVKPKPLVDPATDPEVRRM